MAQLRRPIASLLNGVSQEAPSLRLPSQCDAQVNGYSSLSDGLRKRPALEHIKKLTGTVHTSAHVHTINWAADEQFIIVIVDSNIFAYDLDGNSVVINSPAGLTYLNITASEKASEEFAVVTVEDITYIVNKTTAVAFDGVTTAGGTYKGKKQDIAALPGAPTGGDTWLIVGDGNVKAQGWYMQWNGTTSVWEEVANPGDAVALDATTMPHKLTYNSGTGQFTFDVETWSQKNAGDAVTAPDPSFVTRKITDIFFHRNRLGVTSGEYTVMSAAGPDYTNFFRTTTTTVLDSDRIDLRAANVRVSKLTAALPFNRQLFTTSTSSQFILSTAVGQVLTPGTATLDQSTSYAATTRAHPVSSGNSLFFASEEGTYASLREYSVSSDSEITNVADNVTSHVPAYIPSGVYRMAIAEDFDMLFLLTSGDDQRIYVYKYFEEGDERVQNAWSYWELDDNTTILNADTLENYLYVVVTRSDGTHLLRLNLAKDASIADVTFPVLLDWRVLVTGSYSAVNDETTWTLPYNATTLPVQVIKDSGFTGAKGARVQTVTQPTATTVVADGDLTAGDCYIGVPYEFRFRFSEQFVRTNTQNDAGSPVLNGKLHLRNFIIRFNETGYLRAEVTPRSGATPYSYAYGGKTLGAASLIIGEPNIDTGDFEFPVVANSENVVIELVNDTHVPNKLVSAEWTGNFTSKRGGA